MKPERWEQIDHLLQSALARMPQERSVFLAQACGDDELLRSEVESLIASHEDANNFLNTPRSQLAADFLVSGQARLTTGQKIGHYKIINSLGSGGMGEVYLAQDTKLDRKVALKILPAELAANQDRMRRFAQEAKAAAALNHPNIAHIYEIGESDGVNFIAMEYIEGDTLRQLLSRRMLELKRVAEFAAQVASGLSVAHKEGIIHRDIKPENLIVTANRQIKILDFGLAKLAEKQRVSAGVSELTTAYMPAGGPAETIPGTVMGTVAYMSPEQARAEKLDHRTDVFSLGIVVYEMLTGRRPFEGKSAIDTLHAIINQEPPAITKLNPQLPVELTDILAKALAKDPAERYQHAGDFELDLRRFKRALETSSLIRSQSERQIVPGKGRWSAITKWAIGAVVLLSVGALAWLLGHSTAPAKTTLALDRVTLTPLTTDPGYEGEPTFSPDGETIAYVSDRTGNFEIFLKQISGGPDINITNNAADDVQPAFSPDGKQIAFISSRLGASELRYEGYDLPPIGGDIWVMPALGGSARRIAEAGNFPSWSTDGSAILYTSGPALAQKIYRVSASGGVPQEIIPKFTNVTPRFLLYPSYSSDGKWIVFEADGSTSFGGPRSICVMKADGGDFQNVASGQRPAWSADSNSLIYSSAEAGKNFSLWRVSFDLSQGKLSGPPEPLTVSRGRETQAAVSHEGKRIAFSGLAIAFNVEALTFDAETARVTGTPEPLTSGQRISYFQSFSPDGRAVVFESRQGVASQLWRLDRNSKPIQLTSEASSEDTFPRWSPDGRTIAFNRRPTQESMGAMDIWLMADDGANPHQLIEKAGWFAWMPDSRALVYFSNVDRQLYFFDITSGQSRRLTDEPKVVQAIASSPDGQWVIYGTLASGNIDVRAIPSAGGEPRTVVATPHQDYHPFVSPSGKWLYFQLDHKNIYRVPGPSQDWRPSEPEKVTNFPESGLFLEDPQISRDGRQLLYSRGRITGDIWIMNLGK
jgi:serine/threonine protein kinase